MRSTHSELRRVQSAQLVNARTMHQSAWTIGYRCGLQQAMDELRGFYTESERRRVDPSSPLKRIVFAVLRKILHESDAERLMASIAARAVVESCEQLGSITILVHPDVANAVARRFDRHNVPGMRIDVQAADHLAATGCEIQTAFGIIDAGLDVQLDALEQSMRRSAPDSGNV